MVDDDDDENEDVGGATEAPSVSQPPPENRFARFVQPPPESQPAEQPTENRFAKYVQQDQPAEQPTEQPVNRFAKYAEPQRQQAEEAPGELSSAARGFAHGILPTAGAVATGALAGTLVGGPVGLVLGAGAGLLAGAGLGYGQEKVIEQVAPGEAEAYRRSQQAHPYWTGAGEIAAAGPFFGVRTAGTLAEQVGRRALAGGIGAGMDAAQQLALKGSLDPYQTFEAGAGMAALAGKPTRLGRMLGLPGEARPGWVPPAEDRGPQPMAEPTTPEGQFPLTGAAGRGPGAEAAVREGQPQGELPLRPPQDYTQEARPDLFGGVEGEQTDLFGRVLGTKYGPTAEQHAAMAEEARARGQMGLADLHETAAKRAGAEGQSPFLGTPVVPVQERPGFPQDPATQQAEPHGSAAPSVSTGTAEVKTPPNTTAGRPDLGNPASRSYTVPTPPKTPGVSTAEQAVARRTAETEQLDPRARPWFMRGAEPPPEPPPPLDPRGRPWFMRGEEPQPPPRETIEQRPAGQTVGEALTTRQGLVRGEPGVRRPPRGERLKITPAERELGRGEEPTSPIPVLEKGLERVQEGVPPGTPQPPEQQAMARKRGPAAEEEAVPDWVKRAQAARETAGGAPPPPREPPTPMGGHGPGEGPPKPPPPPPGLAGVAGRLAQRAPVLGKIKRAFQSTFDPGSISDMARKAEASIAKFFSRRAGERDRLYDEESLRREKFWGTLSREQRLDFLHSAETGAPIKPEWKQYGDLYRDVQNAAYNAEKALGSKAEYRENYFQHDWERDESKPPILQYLENKLGPTNFQKARTIDLIKTGLDAGYKLKSDNPEVIVRNRLLAGADMRMKMELLKEMQGQGMAAKVKGEENAAALKRAGWLEINAPDREKWMIAPDVQPIWRNSLAAQSLWTNPGLSGDAFRAWMGFKATWVPIRLALSAFHPLHVAHINMASNWARAADQMMAGHFDDAIKSFGQGLMPLSNKIYGKGLEGLTAKKVLYERMMGEGARSEEGKLAIQYMEEGGLNPLRPEQLKYNAQQKLNQAWQQMNPFNPKAAASLAFNLPASAVQKLQAPIFDHWIPQIKTAAYLNDVAALLKRRPDLLTDDAARRVALSQIAKSMDNRFGEMFYDRLFWNRYIKDASIGSFLSLGWNLGFAREFGGAAIEAALRPAEKAGLRSLSEMQQLQRDATNKIKFASIYMGTAALLGGIMTYAFTGKPPENTNDFIFPRIGGTNPDGSPRRLTTMFYLREVPMLEKHIQEKGGGFTGTLAGARDMIYSKMLFEPFVELYNNRSYFGNEIWDTNAPAYQQLMQAGEHIVRQQLSPMSISGAQRASETGGGYGEQALSLAGFGPAPAYVERTALQNRIGELFRRFVAPEAKPYEDEANTSAKQTARSQLLQAKQSKDPAAINTAWQNALKAGFTPKYLGELGRPGFDSDQRMFKRLPPQEQMAVLNQANDQERPRYLPYANAKVKQQWNKEHPQGYQQGGEVVDPAQQYNTPLSNDAETRDFQAWKQMRAPFDSGYDYDWRGAYRANAAPDPETGHWQDTFKKPNHPTFSNQSQYAKDRPDLAGHWEGNTYVPPGR